MKIRRGGYNPQVARTFTDREEPRAAFWTKYEQLKKEMLENEENVHVLMYYGIGGIGKSRLLEKLREEMEEKISLPYYADIDLNDHRDSRDTLDKLKNKLEKKYGFKFPLFELGNYVYAVKIGETAESPEVKTMVDKSPFLSILKSAAGVIPVVNIATNILDIVDTSVSYAIDYFKKHKRDLVQLEIKSAEELRLYLPYLFAQDMTHNLEKVKEPMVIFIDTYEKLVNELIQVGDPLRNDLWIREENGLIQNIPNVLWVIGGREKLKWASFDSEWEDALEQYLLGDLSYSDAVGFLENEGVDDPALREALYNLTKGTPVYLNLCMDQFAKIKEKGETPIASMFGNDIDTLIERFVRYMGDSQKDYIYMLSCIKTWDDELLTDIAPEILTNFSITAYEKAKEYSFVSENDGVYSIHQTVGEVLFKKCPDVIKKRTAECLKEKSEKIISEGGIISSKLEKALSYLLLSGIVLCKDNEELHDFYVKNVQEQLQNVIEAGFVEHTEIMIDTLLAQCVEEDILYACACRDKAYLIDFCGDSKTAKVIAEKSIEVYTKILGEDHHEPLKVRNNVATYCANLGEYKKALEIQSEVAEKLTKILGENHPDTLRAMHNLAGYYDELGDTKKALEIIQEVVIKKIEVLGEKHDETLKALNNMAHYHHSLGIYKKALEIQLDINSKCMEFLGENHPLTITSMNNLASYYHSLGEHKKALEITLGVITKKIEIFGEKHPLTLASMNNLSSYYSRLGEHRKALETQQNVVETYIEIWGEDHPETICAMNNLAGYYHDLGDKKKALELEKEVVEKHIKELGEHHPETLRAMNNLASYYESSGDVKTALEMAHEIAGKCAEYLGEDNPLTITSFSNMATYCAKLGDFKNAVEIMQNVVEKSCAVLGERHPDTVNRIEFFIMLLIHVNKPQKAAIWKNRLKNVKKGKKN